MVLPMVGLKQLAANDYETVYILFFALFADS